MTTELDIYNATDEQILAAGFPEFPVDEAAVTSNPAATDESTTEDTTVVVDDGANTTDESTTAVDPEVSDEVKNEEDTSDAAKQLADLFTPFTANGKTITVDNIDDAKRLMQMGAGFNKKMATLKPHLKLVKMLDQHGLLDEAKLAHLIDISKHNPDAIGKLLAESDIDPLNLKPGNTYTPNTYTVSDAELELDNVLADLKGSEHYTQTLDIFVNKWDATSKQLLVSNPSILPIIHDQVASGIFDKVMTVVDRERVLGRLTGLSDLEAYKLVGDKMDADGLFAKPADKSKAPPPVTKEPSAEELKLKSRKLAASPTKTSPKAGKDLGNFNPLTATDEEIMNMSLDKFL